MPPGEKKLVILDLDETLIHSRVELLDHPCDLEINPLYVYVRPHAEKLIKAFAERFSIAVWSAGSPKYVRRITEHLLEGLDPVVEPVFVWDRDACSKKASPFFSFQEIFTKDLRKVEQFGFELDSILIVEDDPIKISEFKDNAIIVKQYFGESSDNELELLAGYVKEIEAVGDFRKLDKNIWCFGNSNTMSGERQGL